MEFEIKGLDGHGDFWKRVWRIGGKDPSVSVNDDRSVA
jgi:hypothetical protein